MSNCITPWPYTWPTTSPYQWPTVTYPVYEQLGFFQVLDTELDDLLEAIKNAAEQAKVAYARGNRVLGDAHLGLVDALRLEIEVAVETKFGVSEQKASSGSKA